ncbi:MAG TPA: SDR family NAD(P)-dependent oxidoreductase [Bradyrhizobium sp.]|uniref:SDR family NAD(P)-dependent oxidoreductase n=1 Tax=Bradyrhizobium sp. TaxID=376 RepID=UPI002D7E2CBE|nr:SDR family NAD(P)-dependent oxidoreductase [Bradyrhizobium sp.]HET7885641.1 SDR family NAD(P)-dependent oxidoreductase [Bradyrhizobium sp.]
MTKQQRGLIDRFGPWALVTGASSGIGAEFARQLARAGLNVVLAARRETLLDRLGQDLQGEFGVETRSVVVDLSETEAAARLHAAVEDLDIGLVVSNAGTGDPGSFLSEKRDEMIRRFRLNALAHLDIAHHFSPRLAIRGCGGLILGGAMGAAHGIPFMANDAGSKAFVQSFGESLHRELRRKGVHVTVLVVPPTDTAILSKFGLDPATMPMKPISTSQCVDEALEAVQRNQSLCLPGAMNRVMSALIPASIARIVMGKMIEQTLAKRMRA